MIGQCKIDYYRREYKDSSGNDYPLDEKHWKSSPESLSISKPRIQRYVNTQNRFNNEVVVLTGYFVTQIKVGIGDLIKYENELYEISKVTPKNNPFGGPRIQIIEARS